MTPAGLELPVAFKIGAGIIEQNKMEIALLEGLIEQNKITQQTQSVGAMP